MYQDWYTKGANPGSLSATSPLAVAQYEQELNEPPPEDLQALEQMLSQQQWGNAEIAARMMVSDYPSRATARDCLNRVMEMETVNVK